MTNYVFPEISLLHEIRDVFRSKTLYLLGAGVSAKYINLRYDLYSIAREELDKRETYPLISIDNVTLTEEERARFEITGSKHIFHETPDGKLLIDNTNLDLYDELIHCCPGHLEVICALVYSLDSYPKYCPEYQIFNLANPASYIISTNHDGLADYFVNRLKIISLHGTITPQQKNIMRKFIPYMLDINIKNIFLKELYLATKESEKLLLNSKSYTILLEILKHQFQYIVIIGYSFFKKNDCDIYDVLIYDLICSYILEFGSQVIIIDPEPYFVADILAKRLSLQKVKSFKIFWGSFTHAFYFMNKLKHYPTRRVDMIDIKRFINFYTYFRSIDLQEFNMEYSPKCLRKKSYD